MAEELTETEGDHQAEGEPRPEEGGQKGHKLGSLKGDAPKGDKRRAYISIALGLVGAIIGYLAYRSSKAKATASAGTAAAASAPYTYPAGMGAGSGDVAGDTGSGGTVATAADTSTGSATIPAGSSGVTGGVGDQSVGGETGQVGATPPATPTSAPTYASPSAGQIPYTSNQLAAAQSVGNLYGATGATQGTNAYGVGVIDYQEPGGGTMEIQSQSLPKNAPYTVSKGVAGPVINVT